MKSFTMKLPDELLAWLEGKAKAAKRPKSTLVREILERYQHQCRLINKPIHFRNKYATTGTPSKQAQPKKETITPGVCTFTYPVL